MLAVLFFGTTVICAVGWGISWLLFKATAQCFKEKGYPIPRDEEIRKNVTYVIKKLFRD